MKKLVLHPALDDERLQQIEQLHCELKIVNCSQLADAIREIREADGFYGKMLPELLQASTQLRWIQSPTASLEHYLFPELIEHPAQLTNMRGLFHDVIADQVFAYILMFARRMHIYLAQQLQQRWAPVGGENARADYAVGPGNETSMDRAHQQLADATLGIFGLGSIGQEIARYGKRLGMNVIGVDPYCERPDCVDDFGNLSFLDELLEQSDFLVIAAPHTPETEGFFNLNRIQKMKPSAFLINIGRGVIVPLDDLVQALQTETIAGAALDVFEIEPLPEHHPLWLLPNVILTPHIAACTPKVPQRHLELLLENIRRFANDEPLLNVVNKALWF
ncbi:MAG: D-2-hydroxyacid dehydrogenase [Planctomycetaceae bacterium]|nr:D-2-hydroxyacid dehydrogenase [Planctomycetaceae bacterium]